MKPSVFTVIFDMDGVIFDTERIMIDYWKKTAEKYNIDSIEETCLKCIGVTEVETLRILEEKYGTEKPMKQCKDETFLSFREAYKDKSLPIKPGAKQILGFLKQYGIKTALASSTQSESVQNELEQAGLLKYFDCIIGGDKVSESKPSPQIFLYAAKELGVEADQCFVIEDSYNGIRAAANANMHPIMVPDLLPPTIEMKMIAEEVHNNLFETMNFFKNIIRLQQ